MHKVCTVCLENKPLTDFCKDNRRIDGYAAMCKECRRNYATTNRGHINSMNKINRDVNRRRASTTLRNHLYREFKIKCSITDIASKFKETKQCPICGVTLTTTMGNGHDFNAPSLDRINNENEIRVDNTWIICHKCNTKKGDMTLVEFIDYCKMVLNNLKDVY